MARILICSPIHRKLNWQLQCRTMGLAHRAIASDKEHEFGLWLDFREMPEKPNEPRKWSRLCRVADRCISAVDLSAWDYVLWMDADVIDYHPNVCSRLLEVNPAGITAPLPLVQGTNRLYDTLCCIQEGGETLFPGDERFLCGRNLQHEPPYWHAKDGTPQPPQTRFVAMDCVGMMFLCPAHVIAKAGVAEDGEFGGWIGVCRLARQMGLPVGIDRETIAYHADLPAFGHEYH